MKERPILMSGAMVRATLDDRKTNTRRVVKSPAPDFATMENAEVVSWDSRAAAFRAQAPNASDETLTMILGPRTHGQYLLCNRVNDVGVHSIHCPYGQPGDRLWVRETWAASFFWPMPGGGRQRQWKDVPAANRLPGDDTFVAFRASGTVHGCEGKRVDPVACGDAETEDGKRWRWMPSIHMPRWASRLTLEITDIRVERLQDISREDCEAEGLWHASPEYRSEVCVWRDSAAVLAELPSRHFAKLWDSINGKRGHPWSANDWCWVIAFKRVGQATA